MGFLESIARSFSFFLDKIVYGLISGLFKIFFTISNLAVLHTDIMKTFTQRIYVLIGVVMLFKITVSLIKWFSAPDSMNDSKNGAGNLIKRIVISIVLLGFIPTIFTYAYKIQIIVVKENIIGNIIMGGISRNIKDSSAGTAGTHMAVNVFKGFFSPSDTSLQTEYNEAFAKDYLDDVWLYVEKNLNVKDNNDKYKFHYQAFISTLAGGFTAWIILIFCFDIAVRSVKLAFLQLLAPIPVLSYIDPKGEKTFNNWVSECVKTYLDLFMRLIIIYFAIFLIGELCAQSSLFKYDLVDGEVVLNPLTGENFFAKALIIIGILMFAKELPNLIGDIFGIKMGGNFTLNPLKKIGGSGFAAAGMAAVGGAALGAFANFKASDPKSPMHKRIGSALAGGTSGGWNSGRDALSGKGNVFSSITAGVTKSSNNRNLRRGDPDKDIPGYGMADRVNDWWHSVSGTPYKGGTTDKLKNDIIALQQKKQNMAMQESAQRKAFSDGMTNSRYSEILQKLFNNYDENGNIKPYDLPSRPNEEAFAGDAQGYNNAMTRYAIDMNAAAEELGVSIPDLKAVEGEYNKYKAINESIIKLDSEARKVDKQIEKLQERKSVSKPKGGK